MKHGDVIDGVMAVRLELFGDDGQRVAFAEARVTRQHSGVNRLRATLYDMVKAMMDSMNVEFEYQVRRVLRSFVTTATSTETPVEAAPLPPPGTEVAPVP